MKKLLSLTVLASLSLFISCGGKEEKKDEKESIKIGTQKVEEKKVDSNTAAVTISGNDLMKFDKNEIRVKAGQEITLTMRHIGKLDKKVMGHNFVILKQGVNIQEFSLKASDAGEPADWIPDGGNEVIVHTKMLGGGETDTITFMAPEAGTYDFICSFPGHSAMMKGKFIVE
ncbi:MAG TPA: azurin [Flavobacteriaceae bacterium]|nr:azurin [Flavobacteriaceae bacterium]MCB9212116.1 azurin [Alteromonas sp.]HPF10504.1 azurin [Flavobacteriaceae bacterium]HQU22099.1 azurin [Flavobacteriaceae bacterium]HQU66092.1 azurin [Flavobacteriaceae bacterium]